ncbi:MAG TPA: GNAT family N-acetyltransferase [Stellaceae bacterium]|nr:GNAT family N-acetyltransferase [Stellaceae bacterium]
MSDFTAFSPPAVLTRSRTGPAILPARHYRIAELDPGLAALADARLSIYRSFAECEALWRDAMAGSAWFAFQSVDWLKTWQHTIGDAEGVSPYIVRLADAAGRTLLILPLGVYREGWRRVLRFLGGVVTDYNAPLIAPDLAKRLTDAETARLWAVVLKLLPPTDLVWLHRMPETIEGVHNPLAALPGACQRETGQAATIPATMDQFRKARSSKHFADTRRRRRRLAERGPVTFANPAPDSAEAQAIMPVLARQKSRLWRETKCRDLFAEPAYIAFYERLMAEGMQGADVHVSSLSSGDTIVAAHWGLVSRGRFYFLVVTREDGEWGFFSPGRLLMEDLVEWCVATPGVDRFDLTGGDEGYKSQWADEHLPLYELLAACSLKGAAYIAQHQLRQRLKRHRGLRNWIRRLRGKRPK